jgi:hypothetical protein
MASATVNGVMMLAGGVRSGLGETDVVVSALAFAICDIFVNVLCYSRLVDTSWL